MHVVLIVISAIIGIGILWDAYALVTGRDNQNGDTLKAWQPFWWLVPETEEQRRVSEAEWDEMVRELEEEDRGR